jgi:1,4-alpha-glucan branching enzyme
MTDLLNPDAIAALSNGNHGAPYSILGCHAIDEKTLSIRAFRPAAHKLFVILESDAGNHPHEMKRLNDAGFFELTIQVAGGDFAYSLREIDYQGKELTFKDPYSFPLTLTDFDFYLHGEGRHWQIYDKLGAHLNTISDVDGVTFAVWAPNAQRVSVVGNFNNWDGRIHPMQLRAESGIWELFIPGIKEGEIYKYEIKSHNMGYFAEKIDPYAFHAEQRPKTGSIVANLDTYQWGDAAWMQNRESTDPTQKPMSIYEVHLGSWKHSSGGTWLTYRQLADELVTYVRQMGYTHIELMPIAEHPFDGSWGYQVTGYYAPTSRFGTPQDFMYFVDSCHQHGIGVILDWVPAHFPKDGHALSFFDGTHLYSHEDSRLGEHPDWGTYIFNYGRNEVRNFLIANALFWLKKYHIDGLRVDAVSSMIYLDFSRKDGQWMPNQYGGNENLAAVSFLQEANHIIHEQCPGTLTIAEESTAWPMVSRPTYLGGLGFSLKWNMGWMHDTLWYFSKDPVYRKYEHNKLTFSMMYAYTENFVLSLSHDEVVHGKGSLIGKMPGDWWQKFAELRLLSGYQYTHPGKKLNFMGSEFGQWAEWSEARSLDWHLLEFDTHHKLQQWVKDLNRLYQHEPALYEQDFLPAGFQWIEANDSDNSIFSYIRFARDRRDFIVVVINMTPVPRFEYRIGVPEEGHYAELLNSDAAIYGGSNVGNYGGIHTQSGFMHQYGHHLSLTIPPLAIVIMKIAR